MPKIGSRGDFHGSQMVIKNHFGVEPYLNKIKETKYRIALSRLRCSSHLLEIERGRHTSPKTPLNNRLCPKCKVLEDEKHFLINCSIYRSERQEMFNKIVTKYTTLVNLDEELLFVNLLCHNDPLVLNALGKYVYRAFEKRNQSI